MSVAPSATVFAVLLALAGGVGNLAIGLYLVSVNSLADEAAHGTSRSVLLTFSQLGNLVAPAVGGWLIAVISWTAGFAFAVVLACIGIGTTLVVPTTNRPGATGH